MSFNTNKITEECSYLHGCTHDGEVRTDSMVNQSRSCYFEVQFMMKSRIPFMKTVFKPPALLLVLCAYNILWMLWKSYFVTSYRWTSYFVEGNCFFIEDHFYWIYWRQILLKTSLWCIYWLRRNSRFIFIVISLLFVLS